MSNPHLTPDAVHSLVRQCLFTPEEVIDGPPADAVLAQGVVLNLGLHPGRLDAHRSAILDLLAELPDVFKEGTSFLAAVEDRHGNHWGEHRDMDALFTLGLAIGAVEMCLPRDLWECLPGGMPYYKVES